MPLAVHYRYVMQHIFAFSPKILAEFRQIKDFPKQKSCYSVRTNGLTNWLEWFCLLKRKFRYAY